MKKYQPETTQNNEDSLNGISKITAKDLANRYKLECQPLLSTLLPDSKHNMDSRAIVFSLKELKKFIQNIEETANERSYTGELGIRCYFGKYPNLAEIQNDPSHPLYQDLANLPLEYSFHHTAFLVPTLRDDRHVDCDIDISSGPFSGTESSDGGISIENGNKVAIMNHGNISPPPFSASDRDNRTEGLSF